jgi:hypothetical protein
MNKGMVGAPYEYPDSYIHFLAFLKIGFMIPYRTVQGIVRGLSDYVRLKRCILLKLGEARLRLRHVWKVRISNMNPHY